MPTLPLSADGLEEATSQVNQFADELALEASRVASRNEAEQASAAHVRRAANHLYSSGSSRRAQAFSSVGGVLAGAAGSALVTFLVQHPPEVAGVGASAALLAAGVAALSVGLAAK